MDNFTKRLQRISKMVVAEFDVAATRKEWAAHLQATSSALSRIENALSNALDFLRDGTGRVSAEVITQLFKYKETVNVYKDIVGQWANEVEQSSNAFTTETEIFNENKLMVHFSKTISKLWSYVYDIAHESGLDTFDKFDDFEFAIDDFKKYSGLATGCFDKLNSFGCR